MFVNRILQRGNSRVHVGIRRRDSEDKGGGYLLIFQKPTRASTSLISAMPEVTIEVISKQNKVCQSHRPLPLQENYGLTPLAVNGSRCVFL